MPKKRRSRQKIVLVPVQAGGAAPWYRTVGQAILGKEGYKTAASINNALRRSKAISKIANVAGTLGVPGASTIGSVAGTLGYGRNMRGRGCGKKACRF